MPAPPSASAVARRRFGADVAITLGAKVTFIVLGGLATVIVARQLGPSGQGTFAVAFNLTLMLVQLGSLGLQVANTNVAARIEAQQGGLIANSLWLAAGVGLFLLAMTALLRIAAPAALPGLGWLELGLALVALPPALGVFFTQGVLLGQGRLVAYNGVEVAQAAAALLGIVCGFTFFRFGIAGVLGMMAVSRFLSLFLAVGASASGRRVPRGFDRHLLRSMLGDGLRVYAASLIAFALIRLDLLFVNALVGARDAGIYSLAGVFAEGLVLFPLVIGVNLLPRLAGADMAALTAKTFRVVALIYGLACALALAAVEAFASIVFGPAYAGTVGLFVWLLPGVFCLGMLSILGTYYSASGYPATLIAAWLTGLGLNVVLNLALLPVFGVVVAPLSSTLCYGLVLALHARRFVGEIEGVGLLRPRVGETLRTVQARLARS